MSNKEKIDIYNAEHPTRKKAIKIMHSFSCLEKLKGKAYYDAEDTITLIIDNKNLPILNHDLSETICPICADPNPHRNSCDEIQCDNCGYSESN